MKAQPTQANWWRYVELLSYLPLLYFTGLMVLISFQYIPINHQAAFLRVKQDVIGLIYYQYVFFIHVYTSILVLLAGLVQFSHFIRANYPLIHRVAGRWYVGLILLAASPSGLVMGFHANGGLSAQISFTLLAMLWFAFTYKGYTYARQKQWRLHRNFMLRSFALTLSAISLRLFKWILVSTLALPPMDTYVIVAWGGWVVNLLLIECYIYWYSRSRIHTSKSRTTLQKYHYVDR